nr:hypothetical protein [Desulfosoma caldarium]
MYLDTYHSGMSPDKIQQMCEFDLDISRVSGETVPPTYEVIHLIHGVLDPDRSF